MNALPSLLAKAAARAAAPGAYAGEVTPQEAWDFMQTCPGAALVDVRTPPEWQFVGLPETAPAGKLVAVPWKLYPGYEVNPKFASQLAAEGITPDMPLFFLCRSGGRSLDAAIAMTRAGYGPCFNVIGGFEGEPDAARHRGTQGGWKAAGLPWGQA